MANTLIGAEVKVLGAARVSHNDDTTPSVFNFGSPTDIDLRTHLTGAYHGGRVLVVVTADAGSGDTDNLTVVVQDAQDNGSGAISTGTLDDAVVNYPTNYGLDGGDGHHRAVIGVQVMHDRPWLRISVSADGDTDTFVCHALVLAVPQSI